MQAQMDREFNEMFQQFRTQPQFNAFQAYPNYSLSLNVQDLKDRYEVRAYLPDAKASDVHVTLDNSQSLKVEVNSKQTPSSAQPNQTSQVAEWGQYEQVIQLPTPVNAAQMKVKHEGHDLIITIPKAG
jgi:HSP20 family molecular chaperone IbpA